jgi:hypothetical protein
LLRCLNLHFPRLFQFLISNFYFWSSIGYFEPANSSLPLLHTWSLGVEEQFYLFWPFVLLLAFSFSKRIRMTDLFAIIFLLSLVLAISLVRENREAVFYLMPFRIQQFSIGALIALTGPLISSTNRNAIFVLAIFWFLGLSVFVDGRNSDYGVVLFNTTIVAGFLLWGSNSVAGRTILCRAPLIWIGRRSYSIYLVHWPIIVYWQYVSANATSLIISFLQIVASMIIGAVLYQFVEKKFRLSRQPTSSDIVRSSYVAISLAFLSLFFGFTVFQLNGIPARLSDEIRTAEAQFRALSVETAEAQKREQCSIMSGTQVPETFDRVYCAPSTEGKRSYLVLGDSWASNSYLILTHAYPEIEFGLLSVPACRLRVPIQLVGSRSKECIDHYNFAFEDMLGSGDYEGVVISSNWQSNYSDVFELEEYLKAKSLRVVVITNYMIFNQHIPSQIFGAVRFDSIINQIEQLAQPKALELKNAFLSNNFKNSDYISMVDIQCLDHCVLVDENLNLLYLDTNHISIAGGAVFGDRMRNTYPMLF